MRKQFGAEGDVPKTHQTEGSRKLEIQFKADRLQMIVVAKKYICVATVHQ